MTQPLRFCKFPGCSNLVRGGLCPEHKKLKKDKKKQADAFYTSTPWKRLRDWHLAREPMCVRCGAPGQVVDHVVPIKSGGSKMSAENLQTLCRACDNQKHREKGLAGKGKVYEYDNRDRAQTISKVLSLPAEDLADLNAYLIAMQEGGGISCY